MAERSSQPVRVFIAFVCGYAVSAYGTYLNLVALSLFTFEVTGSAFGTGVVMALRLVSGFVGGMIAGRLISRTHPRTLMIGADLVQLAAMLGLAFIPGLAVLGVTAVVLGAGNAVFTVALRTSVPEMVGQQEKTRANGYLVTGRSVATVLGLASAGIIIPAWGLHAAFLVNAASFVVSAAVVAVLPSHTTVVGREAPSGMTPSKAQVLRGLPVMVLAMILLRAVDALGSASHNVALPIFAGSSSAAFVSQFMTAWAIGSMAAHPVVSWLTAHRGMSFGARSFAICTCLMSVSFILAFTGLPAPLMIAVAVSAGLFDGLTEISYMSRLQAMPQQQRGRLFGLSVSIETGGFATGMLLSGVLLEVMPVLAVIGLFHGVAFTAAAGLLLLSAVIGERPGSGLISAEDTKS
jgi:MFS family permease